MNKKINEIKDRIYEAEGLLELLQLRGDRLGDLKPLILARIDEARTRIAALDAHFEVKEEKETEDVSEPEPSGSAFKTVSGSGVPFLPEVRKISIQPWTISPLSTVMTRPRLFLSETWLSIRKIRMSLIS